MHYRPSIPPPPPLTMTAIDKDHHCRGCHQLPLLFNDDRLCRCGQRTTTAGFWWSSLLTVWQRQWWSSTAAIAVIVDGSDCGIEPTATMAALPTVVAVDDGGNNGVFTTTSYKDDYHPHPHCPCPCPPLDKDQMVGWRAHRDASYLSLPRSSLSAPSFSPLTG